LAGLPRVALVGWPPAVSSVAGVALAVDLVWWGAEAAWALSGAGDDFAVGAPLVTGSDTFRLAGLEGSVRCFSVPVGE
jgi:hypothetical protein